VAGAVRADRTGLSEAGQWPPAGRGRADAAHLFLAALVPAVEEALYDSPAMRRFVGIDLGREPVPDETTVCRFRHLLEEHDLGRRLFDEVQRHLAAKGLKVATGTIVDATISMRRPRLRMPRRRAIPRCIRRRKGNQWYFGLRDEGAFRGRQPQQADPRGGGDTGQCCRQHGAARFVAWLHGRETRVWGDQAYRGQRAVIRQHAPRAQDFVNRRYRHRGVVDEVEQAKKPDQIEGAGQHPIGIIKRVFGFARVRYRGLKKNAHRLIVTCALANLFTARGHLLRCDVT
jgi:IS5 family transposase